MKVLLKPIQSLYSLYGFLLFILLMLAALPFIVVASFWGRVKGGNFMYKVFSIWGRAWYLLIGIRHRSIYEAPHDRNKRYIFVANHISYIDIPPIVIGIRQPVRVLAKYEISKVPVFGFIYRSATVMVDRSSAEKRAQSVQELKDFIEQGISVFIFPEGTFNETAQPLKDFYDGAFRIALETGTPIKPLLFTDAVDRLHYKSLFSLTPGICRVVFLNEVSVGKPGEKDVASLKREVYETMETGLKRYRHY